MPAITPAQAIAAARALDPTLPAWQGNLVELAESKDFDDYERQEVMSEEYAAYQAIFEQWLTDLKPHLGEPSHVGKPEKVEALAHLEGWRIAAWPQLVPPLYLSVWHCDKETPIVVFLAQLTPPDPDDEGY
jgi:hypothetical protein